MLMCLVWGCVLVVCGFVYLCVSRVFGFAGLCDYFGLCLRVDGVVCFVFVCFYVLCCLSVK